MASSSVRPTNIFIFMVVKWLGVVYLAWLAWKFWSTGITPEDIAAKKGSTGLVSNFIGGLALGRYAGYGSWRVGVIMVGLGSGLVAAINALGG